MAGAVGEQMTEHTRDLLAPPRRWQASERFRATGAVPPAGYGLKAQISLVLTLRRSIEVCVYRNYIEESFDLVTARVLANSTAKVPRTANYHTTKRLFL